jgi:hypothetical protein
VGRAGKDVGRFKEGRLGGSPNESGEKARVTSSALELLTKDKG